MKNSNAEIASVGSRVPRDRATPSWPMVRLGDVCDASTSQIRQKDLESNSGEFPIYGASGLITKVAFYQSKTECLGVVKDGAGVGRVMYLPPFSSVIGTVLIIKPRPSIINQYLYHVLVQLDLGAVHSGATIPHVYFKDFKDRSIPLPPLSVQREIVARLEKELGEADALAAKFKEIAENADAEFKAELDETFKNVEGEKVRLGEVCDVLAGYPFKGNSFTSTGIKICGGLIISPTEIKWNECKYWESSEGLEDYLLAANDIVMALDRPWIADGFKIGMIEERDLPCLLIQRTARLRAKRIVPKFLLYLLRYPTFKEYCTFSGTTVPHISHKDIERFIIPCPPIPAQRAIVAKLDAAKDRCEKLKAEAERGLRAAEDLRKAILAEAFEQ